MRIYFRSHRTYYTEVVLLLNGKVKSLNRVQLFATPWTVTRQAPLSMGLSRQEYWSGLPCPSPGDLPNPGIELRSPALQADSLPSGPPRKPFAKHLLYSGHSLSSPVQVILTTALWDRCYYYAHFTDKVTEIPCSWVSPGGHSEPVPELAFEPRWLGSSHVQVLFDTDRITSFSHLCWSHLQGGMHRYSLGNSPSS